MLRGSLQNRTNNKFLRARWPLDGPSFYRGRQRNANSYTKAHYNDVMAISARMPKQTLLEPKNPPTHLLIALPNKECLIPKGIFIDWRMLQGFVGAVS